jgi:rifampicin phosphotransferase
MKKLVLETKRPGNWKVLLVLVGLIIPSAFAIVTDLGGPLSHSSIVAREYGIPAVVATGVGTRRIQDGQTITVDGGAGTVELN